ncbi:MAG: transposase [Planctomycetota bacterium]
MTLPRRFLEGQIKAITRRCVDRKLLLLPLPEVKQIVEYALAVALARYPSVHLIAFVCLGNHFHLVLHDARPPGSGARSEISSFLQDFDSLTGRALNHYWDRGGSLWCQGSFDDVDVFGERTLEEQLLYLWCNPTAAGLVERPSDWPGVIRLPEDFGRAFTVEKPRTGFFTGARGEAETPALSLESQRLRTLREEEAEALATLRDRRREEARQRKRGDKRRKELEKQRARRRRRKRKEKERAPRSPEQASRSTLPEAASYTVHRPPGYEHLSDDELRAHFRQLLDARLTALHAERQEQGFRRYLGREGVLAQRSSDTPPGGTRPSFGRNPRIACKDKERRIGEILRLQDWRRRYRAALEEWNRKNYYDAVFPEGTYAMARFHGARVERAPPPAA